MILDSSLLLTLNAIIITLMIKAKSQLDVSQKIKGKEMR